jgi:hypothetical protein
MQRLFSVAALLLLFAALAAPGLEAFAGCAEGCSDDDSGGRCADGVCCSCCTYAAPATVGPSVMPSPGATSSDRILPTISTPAAGEGRGPLHVPKPALF